MQYQPLGGRHVYTGLITDNTAVTVLLRLKAVISLVAMDKEEQTNRIAEYIL